MFKLDYAWSQTRWKRWDRTGAQLWERTYI